MKPLRFLPRQDPHQVGKPVDKWTARVHSRYDDHPLKAALKTPEAV
jgi:hypothetical protein